MTNSTKRLILIYKQRRSSVFTSIHKWFKWNVQTYSSSVFFSFFYWVFWYILTIVDEWEITNISLTFCKTLMFTELLKHQINRKVIFHTPLTNFPPDFFPLPRTNRKILLHSTIWNHCMCSMCLLITHVWMDRFKFNSIGQNLRVSIAPSFYTDNLRRIFFQTLNIAKRHNPFKSSTFFFLNLTLHFYFSFNMFQIIFNLH